MSNTDISPRSVRRVMNPSTFENNVTKESAPLIEDKPAPPPPIAGPEIDDLDETNVDMKPYPGVDDGFFNNIPDFNDIPDLQSRIGPDDDQLTNTGSKPPIPDSVDGSKSQPTNPEKQFPFAPGFHPQRDFELGTINDLESIPDVNVYQHKKTLAQGMMDLALFSANANQLRYVLESSDRHPYFYPSIVMISLSLLLQVAIGVGLIWNSRYNVKDEKEICIANKINNFTVIGIFIVTSINVFVSAFGVASAPASVAAVAP